MQAEGIQHAISFSRLTDSDSVQIHIKKTLVLCILSLKEVIKDNLCRQPLQVQKSWPVLKLLVVVNFP